MPIYEQEGRYWCTGSGWAVLGYRRVIHADLGVPGTAVPGHDGEVLPWVLCNIKDTARARYTPRRQDGLAALSLGRREHAETLSLRWGKMQEGLAGCTMLWRCKAKSLLAQRALALKFRSCLVWGLVRDFWKVGGTWYEGVGVHSVGTGEQPPFPPPDLCSYQGQGRSL